MKHRFTDAADGQRVVTVQEVRARYRIGKTKLYEMLSAGTVTSVKVGGTRLIHIDALEALIRPPSAPHSQPQS